MRVSILENDTDRYLRANGTLGAGFGTINANLATPNGDQHHLDAAGRPAHQRQLLGDGVRRGHRRTSSTRRRAARPPRYSVYPGDLPPTLLPNLASPTEGTAFTDSRIFVSGRAEDDIAIARVEVAIVNAAGQYMSSSGTFSTSERWISAFLNSPGSLGSNYSYTTPIIPDGAYQVRVRPVDNHGLVPAAARGQRDGHRAGGNNRAGGGRDGAAATRTCARSTVAPAPTRTRPR